MNMTAFISLTAVDFDQNGFVELARIHMDNLTDAEDTIRAVERATPNEASPSPEDDSFGFILDGFISVDDVLVETEKVLPLQTAMRIAPDQVTNWLHQRPDPDSARGEPIPTIETYWA